MLDATTQATTGLGWGVIGFGWVARDYAVPGLQDAGGRLVAVADPNPAARRQASALGAAAHAEADALLADPAVQAVYVATPNHLHRAAVERAAAAGKPVLCEKPMAASLPRRRRWRRPCAPPASATAPPSTSGTTRRMRRSAARWRTARSAPSPRSASPMPAG
jgi:hypothetical protein